ncbi:MAG: hypothetical protein HY537_18840 [Deltaproteobacteria bacterium]|nr:hypothetical protein [Deltaproteobacteria bacterium]
MKKVSTTIEEECQALVQQFVSVEAELMVWEKLEQALTKFDGQELHLLKGFLSGTSMEELARQNNLTREQVSGWLTKLKRDLIQHLRAQCTMRH